MSKEKKAVEVADAWMKSAGLPTYTELAIALRVLRSLRRREDGALHTSMADDLTRRLEEPNGPYDCDWNAPELALYVMAEELWQATPKEARGYCDITSSRAQQRWVMVNAFPRLLHSMSWSEIEDALKIPTKEQL